MPRTKTDPIVEDAEFLARTGVAIYDAAPRLGFRNPKSLDKHLRRHKRPDVIAALNRNNRLTPKERTAS